MTTMSETKHLKFRLKLFLSMFIYILRNTFLLDFKGDCSVGIIIVILLPAHNFILNSIENYRTNLNVKSSRAMKIFLSEILSTTM